MNLDVHNFTQNEIDEKFFESIAERVLKITGAILQQAQDKTEISLAIVGDGRMRKLNKMYRGKNRVTDVLSFDNKSVLPYLKKAFVKIKKDKEEFVLPPDGIKRLGEIIICYPQAKKQAKRQKHSLEKELIILFVHGLLHLLGYDHEKDSRKTEQMMALEVKILAEVVKNLS